MDRTALAFMPFRLSEDELLRMALFQDPMWPPKRITAKKGAAIDVEKSATIEAAEDKS
jgi:hypothetical protein